MTCESGGEPPSAIGEDTKVESPEVKSVDSPIADNANQVRMCQTFWRVGLLARQA